METNNGLTKEQAYSKTNEFIQALNAGDKESLANVFKISEAVLSEIHEILYDYFGGETKIIALPPKEMAFSNQSRLAKPVFEFYADDEMSDFFVDSALWVDGKEAEPILHVEFINSTGVFELRYKYIGS